MQHLSFKNMLSEPNSLIWGFYMLIIFTKHCNLSLFGPFLSLTQSRELLSDAICLLLLHLFALLSQTFYLAAHIHTRSYCLNAIIPLRMFCTCHYEYFGAASVLYP